MGAPKQKWNAEEEAALKAGVLKHGPGKWRTILKDPQFSGVLYLRSNVDLKDKWRNMSVMINGCRSREKTRLAMKRHHAPKFGECSLSVSSLSQSDEEIANVRPIAASDDSFLNDSSRRSIMRLDNLITEAINNMREPGGSNKTNIASYIEDQYWAPPNFKRILATKLKHLSATGKLTKLKRKYTIAENSLLSERKNHTTPALEGSHKISPIIHNNSISDVTKSQIDFELDRIRSMTSQEASAAAAQAIAEAEAAMAAAEEAAMEAEAAEADAVAAQAFAEATLKALEGRITPAMNEQMVRAC